MSPGQSTRITVRLAGDMNWWMERTDDDVEQTTSPRGVLDPRQVAHLVEVLDVYRNSGLHRRQIADAFQVFTVDAEMDEDFLRLTATNESIFETGAQLFVLPRAGEDGNDPYTTFLEALTGARIRHLNATHHYVRNCTDEEMLEELRALDSNRFFSEADIHPFDEINEILEWSPAEWDDSSSS